MNALKNEATWAMGGAMLGAVALALLSDQNVVKVDNWATTIGIIAGGIATAMVAFKAAIKKKQG